MRNLPTDRKLYLLTQNRQMRENNQHLSASTNRFASYGPSTATSFLPKLVPQLTGGTDSVMKRFSITSLTGWGVEQKPELASEAAGPHDGQVRSRAPSMTETPSEPLLAQVTGGLFGSWWNRSASAQPLRADVTGGLEATGGPEWYISEINQL